MNKKITIFMVLLGMMTMIAALSSYFWYLSQQRLKDQQKNITQLSNDLRTLQAKVQTAESRALQSAQAQQQEEVISRDTSAADGLNAQIASLQRELEQTVRQHQAELKNVTQTIATLQTQLREQQTVELALEKNIADLTAEKIRLTAEIQQQSARPAQDAHNTETIQLSPLQTKVTELTQQLAEAQTERDQLAAQIVDLQKQLAAQAEQLAQTIDLPARLAETETALSSAQAELTALKPQVTTLTNANAELQQQAQQAAAEEASQLQAQQQLLQTKQQQLAEHEATIAANETQRAALQQQLAQTRAELNAARSQTASLEQTRQEQEAAFLQQKEAHERAIADLQTAITQENLARETIQERLQTELERSQQEFQQRLDDIAKQKEAEIATLKSATSTYENLVKDLQHEIAAKSVTIEQIQEKLTVTLIDRIMFETGSAEINAAGLKVLKTIGQRLKENAAQQQIRVEGHTDSRLIGPELAAIYPTNWELSVARAVNVVRYLEHQAKIPSDRLHAVGYGPYRPVADNATEAGRAQNRRIELILTPAEARPLP